MGSCDHGRAAGLQTAAMDLLLWGIIVPSTGIIEIIPGTQQAAVQVGGSGAAFLPGEEAIVQLQAWIAVGCKFSAAGVIQQLSVQIKLRGHHGAMV